MPKQKLLFTCTGIMLIMLLMIALSPAFNPISARAEPDPTATFEIPADIKATDQAIDAARDREYASRTIFDFHIAYLIDSDAIPADSPIAPHLFQTALGAVAISSWDEFIALNTIQPFQIILIHASLADQVDKEWLANAYRNRIIIVAISLRPDQLIEIVNDNCINYHVDLLEYVDNVWFYFNYKASVGDENQRDFVDTAELIDCTGGEMDTYEGRGPIRVNHGYTEHPIGIDSTLALSNLAGSLLIETINYEIPKPDVIALPTAVDSE